MSARFIVEYVKSDRHRVPLEYMALFRRGYYWAVVDGERKNRVISLHKNERRANFQAENRNNYRLA